MLNKLLKSFSINSLVSVYDLLFTHPILKKNIELTDPKNFKMDPTPPTQVDYNKLKLRESATKHFNKPVQLNRWHKGNFTNA